MQQKMLKKYGKIVNITSIVGHTGNLGQAIMLHLKLALWHFQNH